MLLSMFLDDDDSDEFEHDHEHGDAPMPTPEQLADVQEKLQALGPAAQKIGLYMQGAEIGVAMDDEGNLNMMIVAMMLPGDVAWSDRIHDPEKAVVEEDFKAIARETEEEEFQAYQERLRKQLEGESDDD